MGRTVQVNVAVDSNIRKTKTVETSALDNDDATIVHTTNDITALTPLNKTNVAEIANDANGTAIATAVNGILDILVTAGLMEAPE